MPAILHSDVTSDEVDRAKKF